MYRKKQGNRKNLKKTQKGGNIKSQKMRQRVRLWSGKPGGLISKDISRERQRLMRHKINNW